MDALQTPRPGSASVLAFGVGGKSLADFDGDDDGEAVALQPDGKIVVMAPTLNISG